MHHPVPVPLVRAAIVRRRLAKLPPPRILRSHRITGLFHAARLYRITGLNSKGHPRYVTAMSETLAPFRLSPAAAARVAEILASEPSAKALRVEVLAGGCSGFQYKFDLTSEWQADDLTIQAGDATVFVDPISLELLSGAELDYKDSLMGAHFTVKNPIATSSCGCGTSFSVD